MKKHVLDIVVQAQAGNEDAFHELYEMYYQSVFIKANSICRNEADAKDATQEAFIELHRSLPKLRDPQSFYSWLMVIIVSKCNLQFRKNRHVIANLDDKVTPYEVFEERVYMNPNKYAHNHHEQETLNQIIEQLTPRQAEMIKMIYLREMKLSEIATELNLPLGTVKTRSARAKKEMRIKLEEYERSEKSRLHFYGDTLLPISCLAFLHKRVRSATSYIHQHIIMSSCVLSLATLAISGTVFLYEDRNTSEDIQIPKSSISARNDDYLEPIDIKKSYFQPIQYRGELIKTSKVAYYVMLNFARTEHELKEKTIEELYEIKPLYETMKGSNSSYYSILEHIGWNHIYEKYAYEQF